MILTHDLPTRTELLTLYAAVGWTSYTERPTVLVRALENSSFVVCARASSGVLLGLIRIVSDDVSICDVQDLLVQPGVQRSGVGRALMEAVLTRYAHVMQQVLITGGGEAHQAFYRELGFHTTRDLKATPTNCYYRTPGRRLS